ncbi:hypothetical protein GCM10027341_27850 [Spirosoma knui]
MKERPEKQPIDDLFTRKLGQMSLTPRSDSFERLQARMNQRDSVPRVVFWQNPSVQRYMAIAACLVLVCLVGWLYQTKNGRAGTDGQVATNQPPTQKPANEVQSLQSSDTAPTQRPEPETATPTGIDEKISREQLAVSDKSFGAIEQNTEETVVIGQPKTGVLKTGQAQAENGTLAQSVPTDKLQKGDMTAPTANSSVKPVDQFAENTAKPAVTSERVLVVTIGEPETLVAARQISKETMAEKTATIATARVDNEPKSGGLWQQINRVRQGEVFARRDNNTGDEERGLLGRAYNGLKHNLDKDKSAKQ